MTTPPVVEPLLRSPPFPWADAAVSQPRAAHAAGHRVRDMTALFAAVRAARVGGRFWDAPARLDRPAAIVLRPQTMADVASLRDGLTLDQRRGALWIAPSRAWAAQLDAIVLADGGTWRTDVDPWSALAGGPQVIAHGNDEWVALARIMGLAVRVLSPGRFGAPGDDAATLAERAMHALTDAAWRDPFTGAPSSIEAVIDLLETWRTSLDANRPIAAASGMAWWKRREISRFLWHPGRRLRFVRNSARALSIAAKACGSVAIWPSRVSPALIDDATARGVPLVRVEDGFVRSVGLGVDLVPPSSVVVDATGIHFDPRAPSDLETILATATMSPRLLERARSLRETIVAAGISKYSADTVAAVPQRTPGRTLILVPAQVEDDMSVLAGGGGLHSNLELLRRVRALEPAAEIWFRPHPDVDAGHRKGAVPDADVLAYADRIVRGGGMAPLLDVVDAVHVLTSLTGFEALMRGRQVTCHGTPFYAGWGLTSDLAEIPGRRGRRLALDELVAAVLILYPRYLDPVTELPCPPEVLVSRMAGAPPSRRLGWVAPLRRWQGRLMGLLR